MMAEKIGRGLRLRCPNCGEGSLSDGLFSMRETCDACGVRFERKSGESAGAALIWISVLPLVAMVIFFGLELTVGGDLWVNGGIALAFVMIAGVVGYRHVRGLWVAVTDITGGLEQD